MYNKSVPDCHCKMAFVHVSVHCACIGGCTTRAISANSRLPWSSEDYGQEDGDWTAQTSACDVRPIREEEYRRAPHCDAA